MELKGAAKKEIERMKHVFESIESSENGKKLLKLAEAYFKDALYFYEKGKFLESFEAAVISWAYIDAGLHFDMFKVREELRKIFTV